MTVKEIVMKYLKDNGFDGLYSEDCGCLVDDLIPCSSDAEYCEAGVKKNCSECENNLAIDERHNCADDYDFCLGEKRKNK